MGYIESTCKTLCEKLLPVVIAVFGLTFLSCKRNIPNQGSPEKTATNQLVRIDEPVCGPSRCTIIKGNVHIAVDVLPEFPGGYSKFNEFVSAHLKYPAKAQGVYGRVNVTFVINRNGSLSNIERVGRKLHPALEREAFRIMRASPKWRPGKIKGKAVRTQYTVPIVFLPPPVPPSYHRPE